MRVFRIQVIVLFTLSAKIAFSQGEGDIFFNAPFVHEIRFTFTQPNYWDSLIYYKNQGDTTGNYYYMKADVEINGQLLSNVGVRLKGNSSYWAYPGDKLPFKIDFDRYVLNQSFDGLKKLNLNNGFNNPTMMREKLFLDFALKNGINVPRCTFAAVYVNNTYWGLYSVVEQVNKAFLKDRFSNDTGNLFKGDPGGNLRWFGSDSASYYNRYGLKTNDTCSVAVAV